MIVQVSFKSWQNLPVYSGIYIILQHWRGGDKKCSIKEGIVFAIHNKWNGEASEIDKNTEEIQGESPYEYYAKERLEKPEFHRIRIGAENIEDMYLREYIYEQLDIAASARRSLAQDVRWDIQASKRD